MKVKKCIGDFQVKSGIIVISDPAYKLGSYPTADKLKAKIGVWKAYLIYSKDGSMPERKALLVHHVDHKIRANAVMEILPYSLGVDSGMLAVCDRKYWNDDKVIPEGLFDDPNYIPISDKLDWYEMMCRTTKGEPFAGVFPYGCVSCTAYGDGEYSLEGIKIGGRFVAFRVRLIKD